MEYLAQGVLAESDGAGGFSAWPDTLVGTDSHTVMINSMGILGWGVGGIEAEAAMLGQPIPMRPPPVTGVRLTGRLRPGVTATDLALTVTQRLRQQGVVGHFVEFTGPGVAALRLADRAPVANMAPEYGATMGFFPVDSATIAYLRETGRSEEQAELVEAYHRAQGLWWEAAAPEPEFTAVVHIALDEVPACLAGPRRPHDRVALPAVGRELDALLTAPADRKGFGVPAADAAPAADPAAPPALTHGAVVIASITSCTNTSNPALLMQAALLARNAARRGLRVPDYVKTSFAPGSRAATAYLKKSGLLDDLDRLGFQVAAYGCATCIGNSGPLRPEIEQAIRDRKLVVASALSGNRNFEGRIHPLTRANYLASPALVVAFALRGTMRADLEREPLGRDAAGRPVFLKDIWPDDAEVEAFSRQAHDPALYRAAYDRLGELTPAWNRLPEIRDPVFAWDDASSYIREPPFFKDFSATPPAPRALRDAAVLGFFGDFITTDHISPAGSIPADSPAGAYLLERGVSKTDFNSYGARRGNHEVMIRGTFANIRLRNRLVAREGGRTVFHPDGREMWMYDAAQAYAAAGIPLVVLAGKMYGAGSSRDWAAKGPALMGVRAVIAESFERIHRSNLVEMGVLPLEFCDGQTADSMGLTGAERFDLPALAGSLTPGQRIEVMARRRDGTTLAFAARARLDTAIEVEYYRHGGILPYVLRQMLSAP